MVKFKAGIRQKEKVTEKTPEKTPVETPVKTPQKIIALLGKDGSLSIVELAKQIGRSASAVERAVRKLRETGTIEHIGPKKGGHWVVKEKP